MRQYLSIILITCAATSSALGQGTILFSNYVPEAGINAPVLNSTGTQPLGFGWIAQLFVSPTEDYSSLVPVGPPSPLQDPPMWGYWVPNTIAVPGIGAGEQAWVQVRAWAGNYGATWEEAISPPYPKFAGVSDVLNLELGGLGPDGGDPAYLIGLHAFKTGYLVPEPSMLVLLVSAGTLVLMARRLRSQSRSGEFRFGRRP